MSTEARSKRSLREDGLGCYCGLVMWMPVVLAFWAIVAVVVFA